MTSNPPQGERAHYRSPMSDNSRWDSVALRDGDIIITAPSKSGMTWTQRLVALLVFDGPDLPAPMSRVSPWLDQRIRPIDEVAADLDAQRHRRFIKTHTPLDGLPIDNRVTYICVGRDPRDAAVSMMFHNSNVDTAHLPPEAASVTRSPGFDSWMEGPIQSPEGMDSLAASLHHFGTFWQRREQGGVALFHFADLRTDLVREFMLLAAALEIPLSADKAQALAGHAGLDVMRSRASELAPNAGDGVLRSDAAFFRTGGVGEWEQHFTESDVMRYHHRIHELRPVREMLGWAQGGRFGRPPAPPPGPPPPPGPHDRGHLPPPPPRRGLFRRR